MMEKSWREKKKGEDIGGREESWVEERKETYRYSRAAIYLFKGAINV